MKLSKSQVASILAEYQGGLSLYALGKKYNVKHTSVKYHLLKNNIPLRKGNQNKIYTCDDSFFNTIDTHEKAYWLGFLAADGSVSTDRNTVSIGLAATDIAHLNKFRKSLSSNSRIFEYKVRSFGNEYGACNITIRSKVMVSDLVKAGVVPRKSNVLKFNSDIDNRLIKSYILGIIDGDGCWFGPTKDGQYKLHITSTKDVLEHIRDHLTKHCDANQNTISRDRRSDHAHTIQYGGNNIVSKIASYLYRNEKVFLTRKRQKISHLIR